MKTKEINTIIDTTQIKTVFSNFIQLRDIEGVENVKKYSDDINKQERTIVLNLNNEDEYKPILNLKDYKKKMKEVINTLEIVEIKKVKLERIDIAIDIDIDFNTNFKFLLYLHQVITNTQISDKWYTTNLNTLKRNTIISRSRDKEVCFYDKKEESNEKHYLSTRLEFRYKRLSKLDLEMQIKKVIEDLNNIENNIENAEKEIAERLILLYLNEKEKNKILTFSEFVRKYNHFFYNKYVLKLVYHKSGLKGNFNTWLSKFRESNPIEFYDKKDINNFKKIMIKSIKKYMKK